MRFTSHKAEIGMLIRTATAILHKAALFVLAAFFVAYEIQMCLYKSFQGASTNADDELAIALKDVRASSDYITMRNSYDSNIAGYDEAIAFMKSRNASMRSGAEPFVKTLMKAESDKLAVIKERDTVLFERFEKPVIESYSLKRDRSLESNIFGLLRGITFGIAMPLASLACMFFSLKFERKIWKAACITASWCTQAAACYISFEALVMQNGDKFVAGAYTGALFLAAPLVYRGVVEEIQRITIRYAAERNAALVLAEGRKLEKQRLEQERAQSVKKAKNESARCANIDQKVKELIAGTNGVSLIDIPTDAKEAAEWYVRKGKPYGVASQIAKHCGVTPARFSQVLKSVSKTRT